MQDFIRVCEQAARMGGEVLNGMRSTVSVREKAPADLVTEADLASQEAIRSLIYQAFPDHGFVGEESSVEDSDESASEFTWIVDPLDGTTNYVHGLENYSVSVALQRGQETIVGVVFDPVRDQCFRASLDGGAFLNNEPIRVSDVTSLDKALVAASLPAQVQRGSAEVVRFVEVLYRCQAIRRLGSAALNLCYVASGRLDGYWATSVRKWDVAAGLLLVREAGGSVSDLHGNPVDLGRPRLLVTGHQLLHDELIQVLHVDAT